MHNFKRNSIYLPKMNFISLSSFVLCCTQIYNRDTHAHTYSELRNIAKHRNFGVEKFHHYKAFSLRKQKSRFEIKRLEHTTKRDKREIKLADTNEILFENNMFILKKNYYCEKQSILVYTTVVSRNSLRLIYCCIYCFSGISISIYDYSKYSMKHKSFLRLG